MIAEWRKEVPDDGTVIHLGDVCYGHNGGNTRFRRLTSKELTGERKLLVLGNHDNKNWGFYRDCGFRVCRPFAIVVDTSDPMGHGISVSDPAEFDSTYDRVVSFSHYPWGADEDRPMMHYDVRIHGHIHNNGYTRDGFVPFLLNHINLSVEQTKYKPVNLKLLLDAALLGRYPATTDEQLAEARARRDEVNR